jgi:predicted Ser/Thr protein kinase
MRSSSVTKIQKAYLESYSDYGQNLFDRYVDYADAWIEDQDFKDPDTGQLLDRELLNQELSKIEKPAGIANPKDFRNEVVKFSLAREHRTAERIRPGRATRRCGKSSKSACSLRLKICFR